MLLKNHLIEVFKKASLENNFLLKENTILKWVHRFGIDSLNDLLSHSPVINKHLHEEENHEQISLMDELNEEENQEQIGLQLLKNSENLEVKNSEANDPEPPIGNGVFSKIQDSNKIKQYSKSPKLPLPYIKNLRKWINNDKKAS